MWHFIIFCLMQFIVLSHEFFSGFNYHVCCCFAVTLDFLLSLLSERRLFCMLKGPRHLLDELLLLSSSLPPCSPFSKPWAKQMVHCMSAQPCALVASQGIGCSRSWWPHQKFSNKSATFSLLLCPQNCSQLSKIQNQCVLGCLVFWHGKFNFKVQFQL